MPLSFLTNNRKMLKYDVRYMKVLALQTMNHEQLGFTLPQPDLSHAEKGLHLHVRTSKSGITGIS
ncbi:MAG TPA: hypothetical protein DCY03_25405 [Planctomycetaceae bacterium]|nr:hypothetical protein [Planctomycetaceae bacterium]